MNFASVQFHQTSLSTTERIAQVEKADGDQRTREKEILRKKLWTHIARENEGSSEDQRTGLWP